MKKTLIHKLKKIALFIVPAIFLILAMLVHFGRGYFYMVHVDPEYFHLFNGLNLAIFNLAIDFIHHPGTTIQIVFAISAPIVNFLQPGSGLIANAIENPEQFIHGANILLNIITVTGISCLGWYAYKYTGNIYLALLLQLMPFASYHFLLISGRLIPETGLIAPMLILCLLLIRYIYDEAREEHARFYLIGFAVVSGLGMAGKFLYLPFTLIPLFVFPNAKLRWKYILYTSIATIVFAFPVFVHLGKSISWFGNMFLHSGKWGSGGQTIYDANSGMKALSSIYNMDKTFIVLLAITSLMLLTFFIIGRMKKSKKNILRLRVYTAVIVSILLSVLMVSKHFSGHYYIPTLIFKFFFLFMMADLIIHIYPNKQLNISLSILVFLAALIISFQQFKPLARDLNYISIRSERLAERQNVLKAYNTTDNPLIITSHYRGSPYVESGMVGGFLMSGPLKVTFTKYLQQKYPLSHFYYDWTDHFYLWDKFISASELVDAERPVYIFIGEGKEKNLEVIQQRLEKASPEYKTELSLLHHFTDPDEYFYELRFIPVL